MQLINLPWCIPFPLLCVCVPTPVARFSLDFVFDDVFEETETLSRSPMIYSDTLLLNTWANASIASWNSRGGSPTSNIIGKLSLRCSFWLFPHQLGMLKFYIFTCIWRGCYTRCRCCCTSGDPSSSYDAITNHRPVYWLGQVANRVRHTTTRISFVIKIFDLQKQKHKIFLTLQILLNLFTVCQCLQN